MRDEPWAVIHRGPQATRIEFGGDLDRTSQDAIRSAVRDALVEPAAPSLVIDLRRVTYVDATAIECVVAAAEKARNVGVRPSVIPGTHVQRALEETGLCALVRA